MNTQTNPTQPIYMIELIEGKKYHADCLEGCRDYPFYLWAEEIKGETLWKVSDIGIYYHSKERAAEKAAEYFYSDSNPTIIWQRYDNTGDLVTINEEA